MTLEQRLRLSSTSTFPKFGQGVSLNQTWSLFEAVRYADGKKCRNCYPDFTRPDSPNTHRCSVGSPPSRSKSVISEIILQNIYFETKKKKEKKRRRKEVLSRLGKKENRKKNLPEFYAEALSSNIYWEEY
jgi:hypothetical protein